MSPNCKVEKANIRIRVVASKITDCGTEAIVNSSNDRLILGTNTSDLIRSEAGVGIEEALSKEYMGRDKAIPIGSAIATGAFQLEGKGIYHIIHTVTVGWLDPRLPGGRILATPLSIFECAKNAIELADGMNIKSISFPIIGARPGYTTLLCTPEATRTIAATAMICGIKYACLRVNNIQEVLITTSATNNNYADHDRQILRNLILQQSDYEF